MQKRNVYGLLCKTSDIGIKHPALLLGVFCAAAFLLDLIQADGLTVSLVGFTLVVVAGISLYFCGKLDTKAVIILLFVSGFLLRLQYVLYTGCMERQHDVEVFGSGHGHSGYIEYLYNQLKLPDFDVREVWQFYHPPLHHIISAVFLRLCTAIGVEYNIAIESLQILTLFYSSLCMLISYRILEELDIKGKAAVISFSIIAFHPTFIIFAGSINNDILSITFQLAAVLYTIRWYKTRRIIDIIAIAVCIGLGMMTKLSAWMVAPAVAIVFLYSMVADLKSKNRSFSFYLKQYLIFAVVCVPLGLWWSIRNYLKFSVPPNYIPLLSVDNPQYIGNLSVFKRLFDFGFHQFESVFDMWGEPYYEYNPTIGLFKTAMFGESINDSTYPQIYIFGTALFWIGLILALLCFAAMIYHIVSNRSKRNISDVLLLGIYVVNFVMYYYFCIDFPFTCTQNIRYASLLIVIGAVYLGKLMNRKEGNRFRKLFESGTISLVTLFCLFSLSCYTLIGI